MKGSRFIHSFEVLPTKWLIGRFVNTTTMKYRLFVLLLILLLLPTSTLSATTITGKVISVADGDTITVLDNHHRQTKIRLYGIDTPEKGQAYGKKAKRFTASLVAGKQVSVKVYDRDR